MHGRKGVLMLLVSIIILVLAVGQNNNLALCEKLPGLSDFKCSFALMDLINKGESKTNEFYSNISNIYGTLICNSINVLL